MEISYWHIYFGDHYNLQWLNTDLRKILMQVLTYLYSLMISWTMDFSKKFMIKVIPETRHAH